MPHAFKANPGHSAVAYLVRLHADLGGQMQANKAEVKRLAFVKFIGTHAEYDRVDALTISQF